MFQTRREDWSFVVLASLVFFAALFVSLWDFVYVQGSVYRFGAMNIIGLFLFALGVSIRLVARRTLGKYFSSGLKTSQEHKLITDGIYRKTRHPAYLGSLLVSFGTPIIFSSLYGFLLMLGIIPCFMYRIRIEENMLLEKFGDEYREYMKETKKMIPFIY